VKIISVVSKITIDVSGAPIYTGPGHLPVFPRQLIVSIVDNYPAYINLQGQKVKKDGSPSAAWSSPYVPKIDEVEVPWIRDAIALAKAYVDTAIDANIMRGRSIQP
jgi:hypothetical protein